MFFFKQKTAYEMRISDWSSDVCSSDLDALGRIGFRRSQSVAYRPSCADCSACVSVRVCAGEFVPSNSQKRNLRRNGDLVATACKPWATEEQYTLLRSYLASRHPADRKSVVSGKSVYVRVDLGGSRIHKKKKKKNT